MMKVDRFYKEFKKLIDFRIRLQRKLILQLSLKKQGPRKKKSKSRLLPCFSGKKERKSESNQPDKLAFPTSVRN
jgi:hypothetical protein